MRTMARRVELRELPVQQHGVVQDVERLGARQAVGAERQAHPRGQQRRHVGGAHAQVAVAARAEDHVHAAPGQDLAIRRVELDAVRGDEALVQGTEAVGVAHGAQARRREGDVAEAAPLEEARPGPAPARPGRPSRRATRRGEARPGRRAAPGGRSSAGDTECGAWAASRTSTPGRSDAGDLGQALLGEGQDRLRLRGIPGEQLEVHHGRQARGRQQVQVAQGVRDVPDRDRAPLLEEADGARRSRRASPPARSARGSPPRSRPRARTRRPRAARPRGATARGGSGR